MELRQLEYFATVAEEQNFTRAAARLHVAQPGVSAQIRQLERELGQPLLDRSSRVTQLTEAGKAVLPYARAALEAVTQIQHTVDELAGLLRGQVAIGMVVQCASLDLPEVLAGFRDRYPDIDVTLAEDNSDRLVEGVRDGRYDLVFIGLGPDDPDGLELRIVADEPIVAVVGPDDPLAGEPGVPLSAIADRAVIALPPGTGMRACVDAGYAALNLRPQVALEASSPAMLARLAARGLGPAFVTASTADAHGADLRRVEITDPAMRARLAIAWRKRGPLSPAARAMIDHARGCFPASNGNGAGAGLENLVPTPASSRMASPGGWPAPEIKACRPAAD